MNLMIEVAAATRLCRLAQDDKITAPARDAITALLDNDDPRVQRFAEWADYMSDCPWCVAVWASAIVVALGPSRGPYCRLVRILAVAEIAGRLRFTEKRIKSWSGAGIGGWRKVLHDLIGN